MLWGVCLAAVSQLGDFSSATVPDRAVIALVVIVAALILIALALGIRYIPNDRVGIVEKLFSRSGSVKGGHIVALNGEAGYQAQVLRGGLHFWLWRPQYRIHKVPLITIPQGKIGYIYARDGDALGPSQTLARVVESNNFQDTEAFLLGAPKAREAGHEVPADPEAEPVPGQRGRQRAILREGVYAINLAAFVIITEDVVFHLDFQGRHELAKLLTWQNQLKEVHGFDPVVIGEEVNAPDPLRPERQIVVDSIGIITVQDGPSLSPGEIIAPSVGNDADQGNYHNNYQDPEAFLRAGGRRGANTCR